MISFLDDILDEGGVRIHRTGTGGRSITDLELRRRGLIKDTNGKSSWDTRDHTLKKPPVDDDDLEDDPLGPFPFGDDDQELMRHPFTRRLSVHDLRRHGDRRHHDMRRDHR